MSLISTKRVIRGGSTNFVRSGVTSIACVLVLFVTLSVVTLLIFCQATLHSSLAELKNKVDVTIYFNIGAPDEKVQSIKSSLENLPEVATVTYMSSDAALAAFQARHANDQTILQALDELGGNPLGAALTIKAKDIGNYETITKFLQNDSTIAANSGSIIDTIDYTKNKAVIERLQAITKGANQLGFILTLVLMLISLVITFNTIRLTIHFSREEIGVMRLVGASRHYVRGPFVVEGAIAGLSAALLTLIAFLPISLWFGHHMTSFLGFNLFDYYRHNIFELLLILVVIGVGLGALASFLAVSRYLRK